jgi:hypothetical protein
LNRLARSFNTSLDESPGGSFAGSLSGSLRHRRLPMP